MTSRWMRSVSAVMRVPPSTSLIEISSRGDRAIVGSVPSVPASETPREKTETTVSSIVVRVARSSNQT